MTDERRGEPARPARPPPGSGSDEPSPTPARREPRPTIADAYWITAPGRGEIRRAGLPRPGPGEVLVRALHSAVSRGTEALVVPRPGPAEPARRACGRRSRRASSRSRSSTATAASAWSRRARPASSAARCSASTRTRPPTWCRPRRCGRCPTASRPRAPCSPPTLETAINALWDAAPLPGERIAVIGAGVVGCLVGWLLARLPGAEVTLVDIDPARAAVAAALGVAFALPARRAPDADLVVHASGNPAGLRRALELAGFEATRRSS